MLQDDPKTPAEATPPGGSDAPKPVKPLPLKKVALLKKVPLKKPLMKLAEREQSTISFPYMDMEAGISVAQAIHQNGAVPLNRHQLAGAMKLAVESGNFVTKVATARIFGLIANIQGTYQLTELGHEIVDEKRQRAARIAAFLNVPLYKRAFDEFKSRQLPPRPLGLEAAFVSFGVAAKQKTNARLAFEKSAKQAGFFDVDPDRLIEPIIQGTGQPERTPAREEYVAPSDGVLGSPDAVPARSGLHPFIRGLLDTLPEPGTNWTVEGRAKWLQAAANIFDLMYKGDGAITIQAEKPSKE